MKRMADYGGSEPVEYAEAKLIERDKRQAEQREAEELTIHAAKLAAREAFDEVRELIGEVKANRLAKRIRDEAQTAKNLATVAGIMTEKSLLLEGRPTNISASNNATDAWAAIFRIVAGNRTADIDSTAVELESGHEKSPHPPEGAGAQLSD